VVGALADFGFLRVHRNTEGMGRAVQCREQARRRGGRSKSRCQPPSRRRDPAAGTGHRLGGQARTAGEPGATDCQGP
jgi:hypothetical protein